jgi:hypothetical protein
VRAVLATVLSLVLAAVVVLIAGDQASADEPDLQPYLVQVPDLASSSLPREVTIALRGMPAVTGGLSQLTEPYRFRVELPGPVEATAMAVQRSNPPTAVVALSYWDAGSTFTVPAGTPCGTYPVRAERAAEVVVYAVGEIRVTECQAITLDPPAVPREELPRDVTVRGTGFGRGVPVDLLLDDVDVGDGRTERSGEVTSLLLAPAGLACGPHQVTVRERVAAGAAPGAEASAVLTAVCTPVLDVRPEVVEAGFTALVTGHDLPPGQVLTLQWDVQGAVRPAGTITVAADGTVQGSLLLLRGEPLGARRLTATDGGAFTVADVQTTLVVPGSFQPGRRSVGGPIHLVGRR